MQCPGLALGALDGSGAVREDSDPRADMEPLASPQGLGRAGWEEALEEGMGGRETWDGEGPGQQAC